MATMCHSTISPIKLSHIKEQYRMSSPGYAAKRSLSRYDRDGKNQGRRFEAEAHRLTGRLRSSRPIPRKTDAHFQRALAVARQQQAKSWELRRHEPRTPLALPRQG